MNVSRRCSPANLKLARRCTLQDTIGILQQEGELTIDDTIFDADQEDERFPTLFPSHETFLPDLLFAEAPGD
jgi:hypothetical protein